MEVVCPILWGFAAMVNTDGEGGRDDQGEVVGPQHDADGNDGGHENERWKATVHFRVNDQGEWKVIQLVSDHNHNLVKPEERHLLRFARSLVAGRSSSAEANVVWWVPGASCSKFETMGLLCPHALKALSIKNIKNVCNIPETYILKRWTKDAKKWGFIPKQYESSYQE
ncbi:hypothetical protein GUJ93_ZPchr0002g25552 [Zizania palustris]|uniref:Protein FAR1-RELATED SEQUENCE n=1 Tax=Zizania palustris TaxID=103762 RepID=A0A8J5SJ02_ZIZPA|nr:hypothetical protein GUJ93_ZPchr0002g25552 [Zizania palustris]